MTEKLVTGRRALLAGALLALAGGAAARGRGEGPVKITAQEAKKIMDSDPSARVIDVRERDEYAAGHIPAAINYPLRLITNSGNRWLAALAKKDEPLLFYCRSGVRSAEAALAFFRAGYTRVYDFGGILDWPYGVEQGFPR